MKKRNLMMAVVAVLMVFAAVGCKKETKDNGNEPKTATSQFEGTWKLTIITDSVKNGETWFANANLPASAQTPTRYGRLTVTKNGDKFDVLARIDIAGDSVDYYKTTAVESDGALVMESGEDYKTTLGYYKHFIFENWVFANGQFKADAQYQFNQTDYIERTRNIVEK